MRCLTLANTLQGKGYECHFICREHPGHLMDYVSQQGHRVYPLAYTSLAETDRTPAHARWLGATQDQDAAQCAVILAGIQPHWLVVDHYALDARWERQLAPYGQKLLVIDDLADRAHQCDVLLDQTLGRDPLDYRRWVPVNSTVLCGAQYALLRPEFAELRQYSLQRRQRSALSHLLISMGGVDKDNATGQILEALAAVGLPADFKITVVMGPSAPWLDLIRNQAANMSVQTTVRSGVSNMAQLMADSDLAIGAAGATSWERCCLGLPTIMVVLADNQKTAASELAKKGAVIELELDSNMAPEFGAIISRLINAPVLLAQMSESARLIADGLGAGRVASCLSSYQQEEHT